jgi:hypothetical protein
LNFAKFKDVAELVGIVAIIASLIFVGIQLRQDQQAASSDYVSNYSDRAGLLSELIANNSMVWSKACAGDELTVEEREVASQIYVRYYMHSYLTWLLYRAGLNQVEDDTPAEWFADSVWRYPGFRSMHQEHIAKSNELPLVDGIFDARFEQFNRTVDALAQRKSSVPPESDSHLSVCGASF